MTFVFLILDCNTFYFMEDLPENHVFYVTGASSLKIVFIIIIIIIIKLRQNIIQGKRISFLDNKRLCSQRKRVLGESRSTFLLFGRLLCWRKNSLAAAVSGVVKDIVKMN